MECLTPFPTNVRTAGRQKGLTGFQEVLELFNTERKFQKCNLMTDSIIMVSF